MCTVEVRQGNSFELHVVYLTPKYNGVGYSAQESSFYLHIALELHLGNVCERGEGLQGTEWQKAIFTTFNDLLHVFAHT